MAKVGLEARLSQLLGGPILQLSLKPMNGTVGVFIYSAQEVFPREGGCLCMSLLMLYTFAAFSLWVTPSWLRERI